MLNFLKGDFHILSIKNPLIWMSKVFSYPE